MRKRTEDPVELLIETAMRSGGVRFTREGEEGHPDHNLDFHLHDFDVAVEVKRFATSRSAAQLERHENIILIQGIEAAKAFAHLLATK